MSPPVMVPPASGRYAVPEPLPDTVHLVPSQVYVAPFDPVQVSLIAGPDGKSSGTALSSVNHRDLWTTSRRNHHGDAGPVFQRHECDDRLEVAGCDTRPVLGDDAGDLCSGVGGQPVLGQCLRCECVGGNGCACGEAGCVAAWHCASEC